MMARWLGLPDRRSEWIFSLAMLCIVAGLIAAAMGPVAKRFDLLMAATLTGWLGAHLLDKPWRSLSKTLPQIYEERLRTGARMSFASKLLNLLCIGLGIIAFVTKYAA